MSVLLWLREENQNKENAISVLEINQFSAHKNPKFSSSLTRIKLFAITTVFLALLEHLSDSRNVFKD